MEESFHSCVLFYDGSGTIALTEINAQFHPGRSLAVNNPPGKIYLAGGFPDFTPTAEFPLSPAFLLNAEFGNLSREELLKVGEAELNRLNTASYRSYTREPDHRIAVLADRQDLLTDFLDTYGGTLEIEPLLLKGYDPDYTTANDVRIDMHENGHRITYSVRTPIDTDKCTYCGLCGGACEEDCLSEKLFLDLSRCTYCNKCIQVCKPEAIDLYNVENRTLDIPAIVLLGNPNIELPADRRNIYTQDTMRDLFSSLVPVQIDETVSCHNSVCQYIPRLNAGCDLCVGTCPEKAVSKTDNGISIMHDKCIECGACIAICPTGAMQYELLNDRTFVDWLATVSLPKDCTVVIGSDEKLHKLWWKKSIPKQSNVFFLVHPNVRAMNAMQFLLLLAEGAGRVILLDDDNTETVLPVAGEMTLANSIFASLFGPLERVLTSRVDKLQELLAEKHHTPLKETYGRYHFTSRREKLGSVLTFLMDSSEGTATKLPLRNGYVQKTFGAVQCDGDKCTHCGACLNECRINALTSDEETLSLNHLGINCVQCGVCALVCPEDALSLEEGLQLEPAFFSDRELTRAEAIRCRECGKPFGTRKSFEKVMEKLKNHGTPPAEDNFFDCCEKCRVIKLFESYQ